MSFNPTFVRHKYYIMAEPFITKECDPLDDDGHLTSCFIEALAVPDYKVKRTERDISKEHFKEAQKKAIEKIKLLYSMIEEEL
jgi:hypothetical protein